MEQVSRHMCLVFLAVKDASDWLTSKDVAAVAHVSERTARLHLLTLTQSGLIEQASVFPGYRYRYAPDKPDRALLKKIEYACSIFIQPR